ncbi:LysR family transcriptional regulator [Paracoccus aurantiacus]|uniref:LysR family transcriptional regulator n=1 Tax=Paracoccus aurantiacus TaxID=2599412 RepID=A0A5C6SAJ9_9RHOB|nr:LysR family transcriptional regulator [Paracoccus aurantiacus]TXB70615.1 LysR family transcriptional regulator [Paracoccus aurantiacus]
MAQVDLAELNTFAMVADHRSFREAARVLGVSPSAISHTIRNLEAKLDVRLFNRTTRSVALTDAGEQLLRRVRPSIADLENAVNEVAAGLDRPTGSIRISAAEIGAKPIIQNVLPGFLKKYPDIHVEIVVDTRLVDVVADGFDAGIRIREDVPRDMEIVPFGPDWRFIAVAAPAYLARSPDISTPQDLLNHRCIRYRFASGALFPWELQRDGVTTSIDVSGPMTLGNTNLILEAALGGIAIAWLPEMLAADHLADGRLIRVLPEWGHVFSGACLYYPANRHQPTAFRLFVQAIRDWAEGAAHD